MQNEIIHKMCIHLVARDYEVEVSMLYLVHARRPVLVVVCIVQIVQSTLAEL